VQRRLQQCIDAAPAEVRSARVVIMVGAGGAVESVSVNPASLQDCVEPVVRERTFPETQREAREPVTHTLRRRGA
jgi:hypothetical protein